MSRQQVVLVYPKTGMDKKGWACCLPLSVLCVASTVVNEFDVKIIDQRVVSDWPNVVRSSLSNKTLCVGVSSMTGGQIYHGLEVSKFIKGIDEDIPVVWGGIHASLLPEQTVMNQYIDYVIVGDGEWSFLELVRRLAKQRNLESTPGLVWKENGRVRRNPAEYGFSLDELPDLPYHLLNMEDYISPTIYKYDFIDRLLPYLASRGCPYRCIYCAQSAMHQAKYRKMNPINIHKKITRLAGHYNLDAIDFYDDEFAVDSKWITSIAELINAEFLWSCQVRMDDLLRLDLEKLAKNGLRIVKAGLESGSDKILRYLNKRTTVDTYIEVNKRLVSTNIVPQYNFMIAYPIEDRKDLYATMDLALRLMKDNPSAMINSFAILTVYPGTEIFRIAQDEYNMRVPTELEGWSDFNRQNISTPWAHKDRDAYLYLQYSSHFLCSAKRYAAKHKHIPKFIFDIYSRYLINNYRKKLIDKPFDYYLLKLLFKHILKA